MKCCPGWLVILHVAKLTRGCSKKMGGGETDEAISSNGQEEEGVHGVRASQED